MNKKMLAAIVALAAAFAVSVSGCAGVGGQSTTAPPASAPPTETMTDGPAEAGATGGAYVDYSDELLAETTGARVLFFHASWCPKCRALEESITAGDIPDGLTIFKVDYDNSAELRRKYGVTLQTTIVYIDDTGAELSQEVLYDDTSLDALLAAAP